MINIGVGIVTGLICAVTGMPYPAGLGALAAILNFIPIIGPVAMFAVLAVVGVISFPDVRRRLIAPALFAVMTFMEGHFLTPMIVGRRLALNAFAVFLALAFWTWLWGPMGAFLSSPLLIVALIVKEHLSPSNAPPAAGGWRSYQKRHVGTSRSARRLFRTRNPTGAFDVPTNCPEEHCGQSNLERLEKEVSAVKNDISALTDQITDALNSFAGTASKQARRGYNQARASAEPAVDDMSDRGSAMLDAAHDAASSIEETLEDVITQRPLATVGLALGIGFLIGVTWRR